MKQLIFTLSLIALVSCKDIKKQEQTIDNTHAENHNQATKELHQDDIETVYNNAWMKDIQLNNGAKWEANSETNEGVSKMQDILKTQSTNTIEDYQKLTEQLNLNKDYIIKKCSMKGASHDNLHVWLLPLMSKLEALTEANTLDEAEKIKQSLEENINSYNIYFK